MNAFNPDYNLIADYAEMGGHETTAHVFRNKSKTLSRENRNMALDAAYNGQFALAKHYANKAENRNDDFYCLMASWAGENGHHDIAVHFINQVADIDAIQFSNIAFDVALKGNQITAEYIVNKINKNEIEKAYTNVAFGAAEGGHQAIAEYFLNLSKNVKDKDYLTAACGAVSGGNIAMAEYFLSKMKKVRRCDLIELRHYASEQDDDVYEYFLAKSNEVALPAVSKQNTTHTASTSPTYLPSRGKPISVVPAPAASVAPTAIVTLSGVIASSQSSELVLKQRRIDKP